MGRPERDIDAAAEAGVLEHRQALVVVHGQHRVAVRERVRHEQGVGRQRADELHALGAQALEHRDDDVDLLAPHVAALARVRVEAGDQDARRVQPEVVDEVGMQDAQGFFQRLRRDRRRHLRRAAGGW